MLKYILKRIALLIPTLIGVATLVFAMVALSPGDPARVMLGERANKEQLERLREELGLNRPLIEQYGIYMKNMAQLDFGDSIKTGRKVSEEIAELYPATIELAFFAMIFATTLGIVIGVLSATRRNTWIDYSSMVGALFGVSMPVFWLALVLMMIFSVGLDWLPTGGRINLRYYFQPITNFYIIDSFIYLFREGDPKFLLSSLKHLVLPTIALGTIPLAIIARVTRSSMLEVLKQDYIKTARSAGIIERRVIYR
ncbi:MAG TPA: ABC transporter permease, partial [Sediminispirochaeta sp.]|nr:ABC transporter permease [Sediminispirochaeta sp.]